jgi:hypothetical protein
MTRVLLGAAGRTGMKNLGIAVVAFWCVLAGANAAHAQRATERYIPIGRSPGVSGKLSVIGTVEDMRVAEKWIKVQSADKTYTVTCNDETVYWLDRTSIRMTNLVGAITDCVYGRKVEIRFVNDDREACVAAWVKVEIKGS